MILQPLFSLFSALFDWRAGAVLRRNAQVYLRNWRTAFIPPALEPVIFFFAFGLGLGSYVEGLQFDGRVVDYPSYVAAGLLAFTAFGTPFYEALYSSYVRMFYQKTWDGLLATQVELSHILWGEVLWAGTRGMINAGIVALVLCGFDLAGMIDIHLQALPLLLPALMLAGCAFAAFGLVFTAIVPSIDHINYATFLIGMPISLLSNTYFPIQPTSTWLMTLMQINPVYHLAETLRAILLSNRIDAPHLLRLGLSAGILLVVCMLAVNRLMRRRLFGN